MYDRIFTAALAATVTLISGCVTVQMPEVSQSHPAHPDAASGHIPLMPTALERTGDPVIAPPLPTEAAAVRRDPVHEHHTAPESPMRSIEPADHSGHAPAAGTDVYVCPMHPEITSDRPGECPICFMDLVLKEEAR